ncbi:MAG: hypothetical protein ACXABY_15990 [Candidatus Thorarchaeota archaeon]|jgi:hypothetical protein
MGGKKYTWKRIPWSDREQDEHLIAMGCPHPGSPNYYSYLCDGESIQQQRCAGLNSSLNTRGKKTYRHVQHYSIDHRCDEAQEALCVRTWHNLYKDPIVTVHKIGECPLCNYHTEEEYQADVQRRYLDARRKTD